MKIYKDARALKTGEEEGMHTYPQGHNLDESVFARIYLGMHIYSLLQRSDMWPWDNNQMQTHRDLQNMIPQFPYQVSPRSVLDYRSG